MTVILNDVAARNDYVASAGQTVFPLTFKFFAASDLLVYQNGVLKTLTTDYTVQGAGLDAGMQITLVTGAALSDKLAIIRAVPYARTADLPLTGPFPVASLNTMLAKLVAMAQQLRDKVNAALTNDVATNSYLDATARRIGNLAEPVNAQDAVTKSYADSLPNVSSAAASAAAAAVSASQAADALAQTLTAYDNFDDRYLGAKSSAPTLDNDGAALTAGTLYYDTVAPGMMVYTGSAWVAAYIPGATVLQKTNNLSDLADVIAARANLGLVKGTAAGNIIALDNAGKIPALDGSQLVNTGNKLIKTNYAEYTAWAAMTTIIPFDDTLPQNTEGTQILTITVTTTTATQKVRLRAQAWAFSSVGSIQVIVALFRTGNANAIAASADQGGAAPLLYCVEFEDAPGAAGTYTYTVRIGPSAAASVYVNGTTTSRMLGGASRATLVADVVEA
jgi:hypothetical protein